MAKTGKFLTVVVAIAAALWAILWLIGAMHFSPWAGLLFLIIAGGAAAILISMVRERQNDPEDRHCSDTVDK